MAQPTSDLVKNTNPEQAIAALVNLRPLMVAGICLGLGQGGFFDGIVLHQLLQWHHMFSSVRTDMTVAGLELNTLGDGLFHLFNWMVTTIGIFLLWRAGKQVNRSWSGQVLLGAILLGFGLFNVIEGVIDHHLLGIHHVRAGEFQLVWDGAFLGVGVVLMGIGTWLVQRAKPVQSIVS